MKSKHYIGRFAPSPSGPLHMGSLVCALASYLDAKANNGKWLLRIEDIDPPREQAGATQTIIRTLKSHGLDWDDEVIYQSQRSEHYLRALSKLRALGLTYYCTCTRKRLSTLGMTYDGHCRGVTTAPQTPASIRLNIDRAGVKEVFVQDAIQESYCEQFEGEGDFVIHRKDGLFAYQLAVVVDDIAQGITHIVRGNDLYDCTAKQVLLTKLLQGQKIDYAHIPVIVNMEGSKLSKQNHAKAVDDRDAPKNLFYALKLLQQAPPLALLEKSPSAIIEWGVAHWDMKPLMSITEIKADE